MEIFGIPTQALFGQLLIGLINGSFYALLSLGLAVIFGLLNIINFTHGAQYMMGAFAAYILLNRFGVSYWWSLAIAPIVDGATGARWMISQMIEGLRPGMIYIDTSSKEDGPPPGGESIDEPVSGPSCAPDGHGA